MLLTAGSLAPMVAQDLYFQYDGKKIEEGSTITFTEGEMIPQGSIYEYWYEPAVYIVSENDAKVNIQVIALNGIEIGLCAGGDCETGLAPIKTDVSLTAGKPLDIQVEYFTRLENPDTYEPPYIEAEVKAWNVNSPDKVVSFILHMGDKDAGVEGIETGLDTVNFSANTISYDLGQVSQLSVYSLSGKTVLSRSVAGNGSVSLDGLSKGIYLYRITGNNGKVVKTAKVIVK